MRKELYNEQFEEEKLACKEAAGWQCEYVLPGGDRCLHYDGEEMWNAKRGRKWILSVHAAHIDADPENPHPRLMCLCPGHHMMLDRAHEKEVQTSQRRRGYELTSTDRLVAAVGTAGLHLTPVSEGYHWQLAGTDFEGTATTAVTAVGHAIARMRTEIAAITGTDIGSNGAGENGVSRGRRTQHLSSTSLSLRDLP